MPSTPKIYTKTGDKGSTRLVDGSCVEKFNPRVEAYGTVDELNSQIGEVRARLAAEPRLAAMDPVFERIQSELFNVGSLLACEKEETLRLLAPITDEQVSALEVAIDDWQSELPELRNFVLPAGHLVVTALHVARTVCRRAERRCAEVAVTGAAVGLGADGSGTAGAVGGLLAERTATCLVYLNRLSDLLFVAARAANFRVGRADVIWKSR